MDTEEERKGMVIREMRGIDEVDLLFLVKQMKVIQPNKWKYMKCCIALHRLDLPITTNAVRYIIGTAYTNILNALHVLGDKGILTLRAGVKVHGSTVYALNPRFIVLYNKRMTLKYNLDKKEEEKK